MTRTSVCGLLSVLLLPAAVCAGDWTQFRGPSGTGVSSETGLPTHWSATENVRWKIELPGRGVSGPVIAGGRVYLTASSGPQQDRLHVLCFDAAAGKKLWERQLWATGSTMSHPKTCMAAPTPVTDGKRVFALFATGDLACLDADGNLLWYRALAKDYPNVTNQVGMAASPVVYKDVLLVPMENVGDSFVAGLDAATGQNRWKTSRARDINWTTPLLVTHGGRTDVLFQSNQELTAYDPETGQKRWEHKARGLSTIPSPAVAKGLVLVPGGDLVALRPERDGTAPAVVWQSNKLKSGGYASPLVYRDRVYVLGSVGLNCADVADGKVLWQQRLKGPFSASLVAGDGKVYVVNEAGLTTVMQAGEEAKVLAANDLEDTILATPALAGGALFLRSDKFLYCIAEKQ